MDENTQPLDRRSAAQAVARAALRRRAAGVDLPDREILAEHEHLLPELNQELAKIALIRRAAQARAASSSSAAAGSFSRPQTTLSSDRFRGYSILREIARGGQGAVFEAIQAGTQRRVAIKVIHRAAEGSAGFARFSQEARFLAQLRHPNIVTVLESGVSENDAFLVMEFVEGVSLSEWADRRVAEVRSSAANGSEVLREIVGQFATICEATHAAHLRGIIHRDLKPANIRVTPDGQPHILDFGLAKGIDGQMDGGASEALTDSGQFVGSLPWSSPEQAAGRTQSIDLRTDVYSLGVILYQRIAGKFPYEVRGPLGEVIDRIVNADPTAIVATSDFPLAKYVSEDLKCIAMRALAKSPERRYQSAGELAADLRRYLASEAIEARRDNAAYVLRKFLKRHRLATTIAGGFVLLVTAAAITFAIQAEQIRQQRDAAREAGDRERTARVSAERVTNFLGSLLSAADPFADPAHRRDVKLLDAVNLASERVEREFSGEPLVAAWVRTVIGRTYRELGDLDRAEFNFDAALRVRRELLPKDHPDIAETLHEYSILRQMQTRYAEALEMSDEALSIRRNLGQDYESAVAQSHNLNAHLYRELGRLDAAEQAARAALQIRKTSAPLMDAQIAESLNALAGVLRQRGSRDEAESTYIEALEHRRAALGPEHPEVATSLNNLATLRCGQKRWAEAEPLLREALSIYLNRLGEAHPYVVRARGNLATALGEQDKYAEAQTEYLTAIRHSSENTETSADTGVLQFQLAKIQLKAGQFADAASTLEAAIPRLTATRGPEDALTQRAIQTYEKIAAQLKKSRTTLTPATSSENAPNE